MKKKIKISLVISVPFLLMMAFFPMSAAFADSSSDSDSNTDLYSIEGNVEKINSVDQFEGEQVDNESKTYSDLENVEYYEVQGEYDSEEDTYDYDYTIFKPDKVEDSISIVATPHSYNDEEHQILIEVGTTEDTNELDEAEKDMETASSESDLMKRDSDSDSVIQADRSASFKTVWKDPINLSVNDVETKMDYNVSGGEVTSYTASDNRNWLSASGWKEASHNLSHEYVAGGDAEAHTKSHMRNGVFCAGNTTHVYYDTNNIHVGSAGKSGDVNTSADGGCTGLLSYSSELK